MNANSFFSTAAILNEYGGRYIIGRPKAWKFAYVSAAL
jgi:hypothetical protein